jgi:hypothetical protein
MHEREQGCYDPETVALLKAVLEDAWASLPHAQRTASSKSELAVRILQRASQGERDPIRLKAAATVRIIPR